MSRDEFSRKTKFDAFLRADGKCEGEGCGLPFRGKRPEYDHILPAAFGGEATLANCMVLCRSCHVAKTTKRDMPAIAKSNRIRKREAGLKKRSTFAASRDSKWKKRIDGSVVRR